MLAVKSMMTPVATLVGIDDPLSVVLATMICNRHSCALVQDRGGQLVGLVSERDLSGVLAEGLAAGELQDQPVSRIMTPDPVCVQEETPLLEALKLARELGVRHFPVKASDQSLVGIITQTDMANAYIGILERQADLVETNRTLARESQRDPLLSVGNRRAMDLHLEQLLNRTRLGGQGFAVALLDLDWFKDYNDFYGHLAGDEALKQVARAIEGGLRQDDRLYRYGGEELLLLMPFTDLEGALQGADRARQAVERLKLESQPSPIGHLSLSGGVASTSHQNPEALVAAADSAMYRAKALGRNRICRAEPELEARGDADSRPPVAGVGIQESADA